VQAETETHGRHQRDEWTVEPYLGIAHERVDSFIFEGLLVRQ